MSPETTPETSPEITPETSPETSPVIPPETSQSSLFSGSEGLRHPMLRNYSLDHVYDEMFTGKGETREHYCKLLEMFAHMPEEEIERCKKAADLSFLTQGITFTVYGQEQGTERVFPYDVLPRIISNTEWSHIERGLIQRISALNMFLHDVYNEGRILADGKVPREVVYSCRHFRREMRGLQVPRNIYIAVSGTDLLRVQSGEFVVLEDNLRVPSGVSYMLTSRRVMKRIFPQLFRNYDVRAHRTLLATPAGHAALARPRGAAGANHCGVDAGRVQLRILRAHLSGAADGY